MKSVKEISAIIHKLMKQATDAEKRGDNLLDEAKNVSNGWKGTRFTDKKENPEFEKWQQLHVEADKAYTEAVELKKVITVWKFNLLHAKKAELLPVWVGVMKEYEGKQIGKAREQEIRDKLKAVGVYGYFSKYEYSCPKISLSYLNSGYCSGSDFVELSGNYQLSFFDENNRFKMPELESFKFFGESTPYIENPKQYVKQLERLADKARKAADEYDKKLHEYNAAAVPGFAQIATYNNDPHSVAQYFRINK